MMAVMIIEKGIALFDQVGLARSFCVKFWRSQNLKPKLTMGGVAFI
jgi:hypothetical protein